MKHYGRHVRISSINQKQTDMDKNYIKAVNKGSRDAELSYEAGWKAKHKVHRSAKAYTRKPKHKNSYA